MKKTKVGIIGTGNIGTDVLLKLQRSTVLECSIFTGRNPESKGIDIAKKMGIKTSIDSIHAITEEPSLCDIVIDATSAKVHEYNAPILKKLNKFVIDLTPSQIGKMCIPALNIQECISQDNVNLITCGGQATIPIAWAISKAHPDLNYIEIVSSIASKSAGPGTRNNIDEFTQTTRDALIHFTGIKNAKAMIILNPAEPPVIMRNTIYAQIDKPNMEKIKYNVNRMIIEIQKYVPGYRAVVEPIYEGGRVTTIIEVVGVGDYLPKYSGNLDVITCAAIEVAENYARRNGVNKNNE